jgi:hypothetical protein
LNEAERERVQNRGKNLAWITWTRCHHGNVPKKINHLYFAA